MMPNYSVNMGIRNVLTRDQPSVWSPKMQQNPGNSIVGWNHIACGEGATNIALGRPAFASSVYNAYYYGPDKGVNGDTRWDTVFKKLW